MNALVVFCHPDPTSFAAAVRDRVVAALRGSGHDVRVTDLYADGFAPRLTAAERRAHMTPFDERPPALRDPIERHVADLRWCEALVLVYPTWWSGQPAMLKGWIDRVWVRGVAWDLPDHAATLRPGLPHIRRIVAVTTHGSSKFVNALEGEAGKRTVTRALRAMCSWRCRTHWIALYGADRSTHDERQRFLARVDRRLSRL